MKTGVMWVAPMYLSVFAQTKAVQRTLPLIPPILSFSPSIVGKRN